jgi:hypothetical protein
MRAVLFLASLLVVGPQRVTARGGGGCWLSGTLTLLLLRLRLLLLLGGDGALQHAGHAALHACMPAPRRALPLGLGLLLEHMEHLRKIAAAAAHAGSRFFHPGRGAAGARARARSAHAHPTAEPRPAQLCAAAQPTAQPATARGAPCGALRLGLGLLLEHLQHLGEVATAVHARSRFFHAGRWARAHARSAHAHPAAEPRPAQLRTASHAAAHAARGGGASRGALPLGLGLLGLQLLEHAQHFVAASGAHAAAGRLPVAWIGGRSGV